MYNGTPGAAVSSNITLEEDAARVNLGEPWRMPSVIEFQELIDNCSSVWTTMNGIYGRLFTSNNNGRKLFLPATGRYSGESLLNKYTTGYYWTMDYNSANYARYLKMDSVALSANELGPRSFGFAIRAVMDPST